MQELTWVDVDMVLKGLTLYFSQTGLYVKTSFHIRDESQGIIGDGLLKRREDEVKDATVTES